MHRLALVGVALGAAGCGSLSAAQLPPPAAMPASREPVATPAGQYGEARSEPVRRPLRIEGRTYRIDRRRDLLSIDGGPSVRTGREPIDVAMLDRGEKVAVLTGRERTLEIYDATTLERVGRTGAGIGPAALATDGVEILYVTDVMGDALLVYHLRPRFELIRRVHRSGGPYAIAYDRERWGLWMTLARTSELVHYAAGSRPVWRETFPSIRSAKRILVRSRAVDVRSDYEFQSLRVRAR